MGTCVCLLVLFFVGLLFLVKCNKISSFAKKTEIQERCTSIGKFSLNFSLELTAFLIVLHKITYTKCDRVPKKHPLAILKTSKNKMSRISLEFFFVFDRQVQQSKYTCAIQRYNRWCFGVTDLTKCQSYFAKLR